MSDHDGTPGPGHPPVDEGELGFDLPEPAKLTTARAVAIVLGVTVVLGGAFFATYLPKRQARATLEEAAGSASGISLRVSVTTPKLVKSEHVLVLPGSVQALQETVVYSRANGYVRRWLVDIGDKVTEGQLLAELDTPEIDQELLQARAQLAQAQAGVLQARANREFSRSSFERYKQLVPAGVATKQELEQKQAQAAVDEANVTVAEAAAGAQQANIQRFVQLKSFARVVAPFDGTIVSRTIERGALVTAGNATPMFKIAATDPMRVFVAVPQDVAPSVRTGEPAPVTVREYAGRIFDGKIARTAGALDAASRTLNTEVRVPNPKGELFSGMYAEVSLTLPSPHRVFEVPPTALMNDSRGLRLAVVGPDDKIHQIPVVIERDTGSAIQISSGLDGTERVVKLASTELTDGRSVVVAAP